MGAGKFRAQASQGATVPRVGKVSVLQAASPLKPEADIRQFSVNGVKATACFMARKSRAPPFVSPLHPLFTGLILTGGKEISIHFVALFPITHPTVSPSVLSLTSVPLHAPKGCWFYSFSLSEVSFSSLLLCWTPLTSALCPQSPLGPSEPFSLFALPCARLLNPAHGSGSAWPHIHMKGITFNSVGLGFCCLFGFFCVFCCCFCFF